MSIRIIRLLAAEQRLGQRARQLRLADTGGTEEQEAADGPVRVAEPGPGPPDRLGDGRDGLVLADDPLVQVLLEPQQPVLFFLGELGDGYPGRAGDHLGDVGRGYLGHRPVPGRGAARPLLQLLDLVPQPRRPLVVLRGHRLVLLPLALLQLGLELAPFPRGRRHPEPDARAGLVDQVDRLVRQVAVGDVPVGQFGRGDQCFVGEAHLMVRLVTVAQAAQDLDGVVHRRLGHQDRLEATFEGRVLLDVLPVLIDRGRADDVQLAAGQRRLRACCRPTSRPRRRRRLPRCAVRR